MSKITNMWWYSTINSNTQIGIVKVHDDITGKDRFYIGTAEGINERKEAEKDPFSYFVDDENSMELFLGYSVAAFRLRSQLRLRGIVPDAEHPLFVYLPCGVGGAPGGICFGLKMLFGEAVHCFFAEPVDAPCMTLGLLSGKNDEISVYDIGLTNRTIADGLAVARPSSFIGKTVRGLLAGCFTVTDEQLLRQQELARTFGNLKIEPSAAAETIPPAYPAPSPTG